MTMSTVTKIIFSTAALATGAVGFGMGISITKTASSNGIVAGVETTSCEVLQKNLFREQIGDTCYTIPQESKPAEAMSHLFNCLDKLDKQKNFAEKTIASFPAECRNKAADAYKTYDANIRNKIDNAMNTIITPLKEELQQSMIKTVTPKKTPIKEEKKNKEKK